MKHAHKLALTVATLVLIAGAGAGGYVLGTSHGRDDASVDTGTTEPQETTTVNYPEGGSREEQILAVAKFYEPETDSIDRVEYVDGFVRFAVIDKAGEPVSTMILKQQGARPWTYVTQSMEGIGKTTGEQLGLPEEFYSDSNSF